MAGSSPCVVQRGKAAILLVAPHGGRRPAVDAANPPPRLRVNDVYSAELTRLLGNRLDAGTIINEELDRNVIDLNRTSQVVRQAPWFLELLAAEIEAILARHAGAEVLFVHGWNVGQTKCDVGFGAVEMDGGLHVPDGARLTIGETYRQTRVAGLRAAAAARGIEVSIGAHYPASHPNNLLQLLSAPARHAEIPAVQRLAEYAAAGRLNALQLELGIPLRWPGVWRDRFLEVMSTAFQDASGGDAARIGVASSKPALPSASHAALQFYDRHADVAVLTSIGRMGPSTLGARMLLFLGGQRVALFTGEDAVGRGCGVRPLRISEAGDESRIELDGPLLLLDDAAAYLDLEAALAASRAVQARVALTFRGGAVAPAGVRYGCVRGEIHIDGERRAVDCRGFANLGLLRATGARPQTTLTATFDAGEALLGRQIHGDGDARVWQFDARRGAEVLGGRMVVALDVDGFSPAHLECHVPGSAAWHAIPLSRMAILRSAPNGYLRVAFGVARYERAGEIGVGLYEHAVPLPNSG